MCCVPVIGSRRATVNLFERLGAEDVDAELGLLMYLYKSGVTQNPQVPRGSWPGDRQQSCQLTGGSRPLAQSIQHDSPARIRFVT